MAVYFLTATGVPVIKIGGSGMSAKPTEAMPKLSLSGVTATPPAGFHHSD